MNSATAPENGTAAVLGGEVARIVGAVSALLDSTYSDGTSTLAAVCDVLWLAGRLPPRGPATRSRRRPAGRTAPSDPAPLNREDPRHTAPRSRQDAPAQIFPGGTGPGSTQTGYGAALPPVPPLPEALALGRALRPLRLRRRSRSRQVVDEAATARRAARTRRWHPVLRPRSERWPDVALVMDGSPSMAVWREDVLGFYEVLRQLAAFRDVRAFRLSCGPDAVPRVSTRLTHPAGQPAGGTPAVPALRDSTGRRLIMVVTDGVDTPWEGGAYHRMMRDLAVTDPVVLVSMLPQRLWPAGGLRARPGRVRADLPLQPNGSWRVRAVDADDAAQPSSPPIPVLDLSPFRFACAAGVLTGGAAWTRMRLLADPAPAARPAPAPGANWGPRLRSRMSPGAYRLLLVMSVIPDFLTMNTIRAVQRRVLPGTGVMEFAEALLSGAFKAPDDAFADGGGRLRFISPYAAGELRDEAGPILRATVWQALDEHLQWIGVAGMADLVVAHPFGGRKPVRAEGMHEFPLSMPLPVQPPIAREVVSKIAVQSRAVAVDALAKRQLDGSGLRLLDARELTARPADGAALLREVWRTAETTAVHIDHADQLARRPELLTILTDLLRQTVGGPGPRVLVLGRRGRSDEPGRYPPLFERACCDAGAAYRIDWALEETRELRVYRLMVANLWGVPDAVEDRLWSGLKGSMLVRRIGRHDLMLLVNTLAAEIGRRHHDRAGFDHGAPLTPGDLPPDIDAFLRSTL